MNRPNQETELEKLVNAFLAWPLPESVSSDQCVVKRGYPHRSGTNLLTAVEAHQMFEYVLAKVAEGARDQPPWNEKQESSKADIDAKIKILEEIIKAGR